MLSFQCCRPAPGREHVMAAVYGDGYVRYGCTMWRPSEIDKHTLSEDELTDMVGDIEELLTHDAPFDSVAAAQPASGLSWCEPELESDLESETETETETETEPETEVDSEDDDVVFLKSVPAPEVVYLETRQPERCLRRRLMY